MVQLFAAGGEAELQLGAVADLQAQEFAFCGALQDHELDILVVGYGPAHELQLETGLTLQVQDLLPFPAHFDLDRASVVTFDALPRLRRDAEVNTPGTFAFQLQADACDDRLSVRAQVDCFLSQDLQVVFNDDRHGPPSQPDLRHDDVHDECRALEHGSRYLDPPHLDVGGNYFFAESHRENWDAGRLERDQGLGQGPVGVVRAVGDQDEARQRHARQLLARGVECATEVGVCAVERQVTGPVDAARDVGKAEEAKHEAIGQSGEQLALVRRERILQEGRAGGA